MTSSPTATVAAAAPTAPGVLGTGPSGPAGSWTRLDFGVVSGLVVLLVLTQRIAIPVGDTVVGVALPVSYLAVAVLLARHRLTVSRLRAELYLVAVVACLATTSVVSLRGDPYSLSSLQLLLVLYLPWIFRAQGVDGRVLAERAGRTFVRVMLVVAAVGVLQLTLQLAGVWQYEDYLRGWIPADLFFSDYNSSIPLAFDSPTYKANAFVMLEPSFLSQFCALAVIIGVVLRIRVWMLLLLIAGLASAVSGTGILLLLTGAALFVVRDARRIRPAYVVASIAAVVLLVSAPTAPLLLDRSDEVAVSGSSGNARFVAPYTVVERALEREPERYVTGAGPGNDRTIVQSGDSEARYANYTIVPKLAFEYGLFAGGLFMLFLLMGLLDGSPWRVVPGALLVMTFFLSGGLLQPQTAVLAWVFTGLCSADRDRRASPG